MIPDNAQVQDLPADPEGFWEPIHEQVAAWVEAYEDDGDANG